MTNEAHPPEMGSQFRELRGVERILKGNPDIQQRGLKFLLSLYALEIDRLTGGVAENKEALRQIIKAYIEEFPECLEPQDNVDSDFGYKNYIPDPQVLAALGVVLNETR